MSKNIESPINMLINFLFIKVSFNSYKKAVIKAVMTAYRVT